MPFSKSKRNVFYRLDRNCWSGDSCCRQYSHRDAGEPLAIHAARRHRGIAGKVLQYGRIQDGFAARILSRAASSKESRSTSTTIEVLRRWPP